MPNVRALTALALVGLLAATPALAQSGRGVPVSVLIGNPDSAPVPTRDVDRVPLQPFRANGAFVISAPNTTGVGDLEPPVPAGKLLVVESVFAQVSLPSGQKAQLLIIGSDVALVPVGLALQGAFGATDTYVASPALRFYVPAGPVQGNVSRNSTSQAGLAAITVVGYLIDAP